MSDGGKGDLQRPTDHKKWSNGYDNIQWTTEENEEFDRISTVQDNPSSQRPVALPTTESERAEKS